MNEEEKKALRALANSPQTDAMINAVMNGRNVEILRPIRPDYGVSEGVVVEA